MLAQMRTHAGVHDTLSLGFSMQSFDDVSWKTAQTTGAFAYMPYADAENSPISTLPRTSCTKRNNRWSRM